MGLVNDIVDWFVDFFGASVEVLERFAAGDLFNPQDAISDEQVQRQENLLDGPIRDAVQTAQEGIIGELDEVDELDPETAREVLDEVEGEALEMGLTAILATDIAEIATLGQLESHQVILADMLAAFAIDDYLGRELSAVMQEGLDPAVKQDVHREFRSKQANFQDYVEANVRSKRFGGEIPTRSGDIPDGVEELMHPDDFGWLGDPDTYGTIPDQQKLYELAGMQVNEPEELIEEPIQYGIPVPLRPIEQVTDLRGMPEDAKSIYKQVIDQLPKTENLIQDYVRLTEFNFRLRDKIQQGAVTPEQARKLIEPELRDIIDDALPEDRLREQDRGADEVVDILADELERNFRLLDSLPEDPPSEGQITNWLKEGAATVQQSINLMRQFTTQSQFVFPEIQSSLVEKGADEVRNQFVRGLIDESEAELQLKLMGYGARERDRILSGASEDEILQQQLGRVTGGEQVSLTVISGIGQSRSTVLRASGIESVEELANSSVEELTELLRISDQQAESFIVQARSVIGEE